MCNCKQIKPSFNASKEEVIAKFEKLIPEIAKYYPDNSLRDDLEEGLNNLHQLSSL